MSGEDITYNTSEMEDLLIKHCLEGRESAKKVFYNRFAAKMFAVCMRYASNYHTAEDMLQEGFITVFEKLHTYNATGSLEGWVRKVIVNTALDCLRNNVYNNDHIEVEIKIDVEYDEKLLDTISANEIIELIQKLPLKYRLVLNLFVVDGYTHDEISKTLNISFENSKVRLLRARDILKKLIIDSNYINNEARLHAKVL